MSGASEVITDGPGHAGLWEISAPALSAERASNVRCLGLSHSDSATRTQGAWDTRSAAASG